MTPQWWIARGAGNCLRWKYRWVNILRLELFMTPQWWIARGAGNRLRWKYRWVKDRYALGDQIGHLMKRNRALFVEEVELCGTLKDVAIAAGPSHCWLNRSAVTKDLSGKDLVFLVVAGAFIEDSTFMLEKILDRVVYILFEGMEGYLPLHEKDVEFEILETGCVFATIGTQVQLSTHVMELFLGEQLQVSNK
ncbi:hypothetical protein E3N88_07853 [Mikania micrantha]|uniref:Uncharacterized protein n=1 Tax=Mikania micrantha TaxID=192012 RepID=A0A5N6PFP1_9ASTR|nr:hypothetical protein E3N88_07853 [Mikania micrantha]